MAEKKRMIRIRLHCDNLYDQIPDSERLIPYADGTYPLKGEPFGRAVAGGDAIGQIQVEGSNVIFHGQRFCLEYGEVAVKVQFMYYKGIVPNPLYYTITLGLCSPDIE